MVNCGTPTQSDIRIVSTNPHHSHTMPSLVFPIDDQGRATGARFVNRGAISCPAGHSISSDDALNTLEKVAQYMLTMGWRSFNAPNFPLAGRPMKPAATQQMTNIRRVKHTAGYSGLQRLPWYDPTPTINTFNMSKDLIQRCGNSLEMATLLGNTNSIGCAPPIGKTGFTGKRAFYQSAVTSVLNMGPFCITNFLDQMDFAAAMQAYQDALIKGAALATEYEKMRKFIAMSSKNASAVAGTTGPTFYSGHFGQIPDSAGSFEWVLNAIERGMGGNLEKNAPVVVKVSPQLLKHWVLQYIADNGGSVTQNMNWTDQALNVNGFEGQWANGSITMTSLRTGRRVTFQTADTTPAYVEVQKTGDAQGQWAFQEYMVQELGDDTEGVGGGVDQRYNEFYGDPERCEGPEKVLCEMILIDTGDAFHYEAFPSNPLGWAMEGVETNLNNLWNSAQIQMFTGVEVDQYYLKHINEMLADTGAPVFNNSDNTWFAGRLKMGFQLVEDEPRNMMALLVAVPSSGSPLQASEVLLPVTSTTTVTLTTEPAEDPVICREFDGDAEPDAETAGAMVTPESVVYDLPATGTRTVQLQFVRTGGVTGTLTVPFTITEGTATEGSGGADHFTRANGNIEFATGSAYTTLSIVLRSQARGDGDPEYVEATIDYNNSPEVLVDGSFTSTILRLRLVPAAE